MTQFQWLDHFYFAGAHCIACTQPANVFLSQSGFNSFISQPISKWTMGLSSPKSEDQKTLYMLVVLSSSFFSANGNNYKSGSSVAESLIMIGKPSGRVKNWIAHVPQGAPPESAGRPNSAGSIHTATSTTIHSNACSTKLSNVVLVAGKTQASNSEPVGVSLGPGGFEDEDETEEREHALSSPIKGNQQLSSAGIVKVTVGAASPVSRSKHSAANRRKDKYTNSDLPPGCKENNVWRRTLILTYIQYMSNQKNAWGIQDNDAIVILQGIWDYVYGARVPAKIGIVGPIFAVADQRLCEWRGAFGSAALMFLNTFFSDSGYDTDEARREFSREALSDYAFLYAKVVRKDGKTFATHLTSTRDAISVRPLGDPGKPKGALALAATAVERALTLWNDGLISLDSLKLAQRSSSASGIIKLINKSTGKKLGKSTDFTQANWASVTMEYLSSINSNFRDVRRLDHLMKEAAVFVKSSRCGDLKTPLDDTEAQVGGRALLVDDTTDDDADLEDDLDDDFLLFMIPTPISAACWQLALGRV
ncbi:hypothetical protein BJV78DRAFT_1356894 [Lactifluus subvellereus]|nr:hypothetical protein BJV78DRAFT_1356894 [Lactifluus subvellereus]